MDSADPKTLQTALSAQGNIIYQHQEQLKTISHGVKDLSDRQEDFQTSVTSQVNQLAEQLHRVLTHLETTSTAPISATPPDANPAANQAEVSFSPVPLRLASPEKYSGESGNCRTFLVQCDLHYKLNPAAFVSDEAKIAFMVSHLTGRAAAWATAEWSRDSSICRSFTAFKDTMSRIFDLTSPAAEATRVLMQLKQHPRPVLDYAIEFRTIAIDSGWNTPALIDAFRNGLSETIKDHLAPLELPQDLESLISMSIRVDNRLRERERERRRTATRHPSHQGRSLDKQPSWDPLFHSSSGPAGTAPSQAPEEPMQLGRTRISPEERRRRLQEGCCFYCGQSGHQQAACPGKGHAHQP